MSRPLSRLLEPLPAPLIVKAREAGPDYGRGRVQRSIR